MHLLTVLAWVCYVAAAIVAVLAPARLNIAVALLAAGLALQVTWPTFNS